jgi:hypothetical protein
LPAAATLVYQTDAGSKAEKLIANTVVVLIQELLIQRQLRVDR